ncbi:MAG TPA: hypothetical protein VM532_12530 [Burkholderiales bacterium]|nr:hypothetical protein [Burkholderiales bacterium]
MKKIISFLFAISMVLFLTFLTGTRDELIDRTAEEFLKTPMNSESETVYFFLLGFRSTVDRDPVNAGRQLAKLPRIQQTPAPAEQPGELRFTESVLSLCGKDQINDVICILQNKARVEKILADNQTLLNRYAALLAHTQFAQPEGEAVQATLPFVDIQRAKFALWAKAILLINDGHVSEGLDFLQKDTRFGRMLFAQSESLLPRMAALTMLRRQYELLSQVVVQFPAIVKSYKDVFLQISAPLSAKELSFRRALGGELRAVEAALNQFEAQQLPAQKDVKTAVAQATNWSLENPFWRKTPLYRRNATINLQAGLLEQWAAFSELPASQILKQKDAFTQSLKNEYQPRSFPTAAIYNRIGKQLVANGFFDMGDYLLKAHDVDGLMRLVNLQVQIDAFDVPQDRVGPFLQTSEAQLTNPYTGEAMLWDAKARTLSFPAQGDPEHGEIAVAFPERRSP